MSVTFSTPDTVYVDFEYEEGDIEKVPAEGYYEVNMANINAADFLRLIDREADARKLYGTWSVDELHAIRAKVMKLKNIEFEKETVAEDNWIEIGRSSEYVKRKLNLMLNLLDGALERNVHVMFA